MFEFTEVDRPAEGAVVLWMSCYLFFGVGGHAISSQWNYSGKGAGLWVRSIITNDRESTTCITVSLHFIETCSGVLASNWTQYVGFPYSIHIILTLSYMILFYADNCCLILISELKDNNRKGISDKVFFTKTVRLIAWKWYKYPLGQLSLEMQLKALFAHEKCID